MDVTPNLRWSSKRAQFLISRFGSVNEYAVGHDAGPSAAARSTVQVSDRLKVSPARDPGCQDSSNLLPFAERYANGRGILKRIWSAKADRNSALPTGYR